MTKKKRKALAFRVYLDATHGAVEDEMLRIRMEDINAMLEKFGANVRVDARFLDPDTIGISMEVK